MGTLRRLREFDYDGRPVLSVYPDAETVTNPTVASKKLEALIVSAGEHHVGRVLESLRAMPALRPGARGLAMFFGLDGSSSEVIQMPAQVEALAVLDTIPWIEPLAGTFTDGTWGVVIFGSHGARLFRGHPRMLVEFATVRDRSDRGDVLGACSQSRPRGVVDDDVLQNARRVAALLLRAHERRAFERLVIVAPSECWSPIEDALQGELRDRIVDFTALDLADRSPQEITRALTVPFSLAQPKKYERWSSSAITAPSLSGLRVAMHRSTTRLLQRYRQGHGDSRVPEPQHSVRSPIPVVDRAPAIVRRVDRGAP